MRYQLDFNAQTTALLGEQQYVDSIRIGGLTFINQEVEWIMYRRTHVVPTVFDRSGPLLCRSTYGQNATSACG